MKRWVRFFGFFSLLPIGAAGAGETALAQSATLTGLSAEQQKVVTEHVLLNLATIEARDTLVPKADSGERYLLTQPLLRQVDILSPEGNSVLVSDEERAELRRALIGAGIGAVLGYLVLGGARVVDPGEGLLIGAVLGFNLGLFM